MNNADFAKLLASRSNKDNNNGNDDDDGGDGRAQFRRKKKYRPHADLVAKGAGGRVDRNHLKEALEKEERVKMLQRGGRGGYGGGDDDDEEDEDGGGYRKKGRQGEEEGEGAAPQQQDSQLPTQPGGGAAGGQQQDDNSGGGYRDRAEERRKGINPDYEDEIARLVNMDAEKTKYLGGDIKHTHLVKGLDYALLQKVRTEMEAKKEENEEEELKKRGAGLASVAEARDRKKKSMEAVSTRTLLGKSIKGFLAQTYSDEIRPVDMFRTSALEYTLRDTMLEGGEEESAVETLPTLISRSKMEVEAEQESPLMIYTLPDALLTKLTRAFITHRQVAAGLKKKVKKRHRAEEEYGGGSSNNNNNNKKSMLAPSPKPKVEIGDIFGDASFAGSSSATATGAATGGGGGGSGGGGGGGREGGNKGKKMALFAGKG